MTPVRPVARFGGRARAEIQRRREQQQAGQQGGANEERKDEERDDADDGGAANIPPPDDYFDPRAKLGRPKTLMCLWREYLYGLDDNKAAKDFTPRERGRQKSKYSRRKCFWDVMSQLIRIGYTDVSAIDLIQSAYGLGRPVTYIINQLQKGRSDGYHPNIANVIGN